MDYESAPLDWDFDLQMFADEGEDAGEDGGQGESGDGGTGDGSEGADDTPNYEEMYKDLNTKLGDIQKQSDDNRVRYDQSQSELGPLRKDASLVKELLGVRKYMDGNANAKADLDKYLKENMPKWQSGLHGEQAQNVPTQLLERITKMEERIDSNGSSMLDRERDAFREKNPNVDDSQMKTIEDLVWEHNFKSHAEGLLWLNRDKIRDDGAKDATKRIAERKKAGVIDSKGARSKTGKKHDLKTEEGQMAAALEVTADMPDE